MGIPLTLVWLTLFLLFFKGTDSTSPEVGPHSCVKNCATRSCDTDQAEGCLKIYGPPGLDFDSCQTIIAANGTIVEKSCALLNETTAGKVGCTTIPNTNDLECVCKAAGCNFGDADAVKKAANKEEKKSTGSAAGKVMSKAILSVTVLIVFYCALTLF